MNRPHWTPLLGLAALGVALLGLDVAALSMHIPRQHGIGSDARLRAFVVLMLIEGLLYAGAVAIVLKAELPRGTVLGILAAAIVMRGLLLASPPFLSTDMHRYVWDGMVQDAGINPYRYRPDAPALAFLRDATIYPGINRKDTARTIYPPFAEATFALVARVSPTLLAMKATMTGFDIVCIISLLALLRRAELPHVRILIYAWHPLPIWEFAGNGHVDAIIVGCVALALLAAAFGRPARSAAAFALAVLAKLLPAILLPALWRPRGWRFPLVALVLILAFYAAYVGAGAEVLGFLPGYIHQEGIASGSGVFYLQALDRLVPLPPIAGLVYLIVALVILAGLGLAIWRRDLPAGPARGARQLAADAAYLATALMIVLTPHYPWYFSWLLVPLCIQPRLAMLYLPTAAFLLYLDPIHTQLLWPALLYGPSAALALASLAWSGRASNRKLSFRDSMS